ncbi:FAD/NAD(P)-binding domain-containing protein [Rhizophagus irregularis]|uniref:FAD/NAD(P)-binding domain-containing protein n=1 Tax=Rhizophagus irregularis TaxID=588596 RepID=A0A2N1MMJ8_9GLOM|nr:FAD/NAD(P)-binding domain-containing protein [Rhizophagus irregularis]
MYQEKVPTVIIIGAGPGGLTLYHSLIKNKDKKEFNVKIFERESGPKVQWGKKLVRYVETNEGVWVNFEDGSQEFCDILVDASGVNSPVRKQKLPELQINDIGATYVVANIVVPKHLMDRLTKTSGNSLVQKTLGLNGDATLIAFRLISIEQEQNYENKNNSDELHYRTTIAYFYSSELDNDETEKIKVDDNNPASVVEHVKNMIRKLRPENEMTNILLELWDLAPKAVPKESENYPFKTYNPIQRRQIRDINPLTINSWTSSRVTLIGDAAHAMSPLLGLGTTHAIQDAEALSQALFNYSPENYISCIKEYENKIDATINHITPVGYFGLIIRNSVLKTTNFLMKVRDLVMNII